MKTIVIWDQCGEEPIQFLIVEGDLSHLHNIYINTAYSEMTDIAKHDELCDLQEGWTEMKFLETFPVSVVQNELTAGRTVKVVTCGFLP